MTLVIDANNLVLGRLASETASILLEKYQVKMFGNKEIRPSDHKEIYIINAEKAVLSGEPNQISNRYMRRIHIKVNTNPRRGPFFPRNPTSIVKRAIRGMLPYRQDKGKLAIKKLKVYIGTPSFLKEAETITFSKANADKFTCKRITVGDLSKRIGSYYSRLETVN
ncbi:MAG: 50S ribosomal protein L13 [Candidatus Thorarchaeota archaeon]